MTRAPSAVLALVAVLPLRAQQAGAQQPEEEATSRRRFRFVFTPNQKRPSFRWRRVIRVDFRAKIQTDFRRAEPEHEDRDLPNLFDFNRRRVGIEGTFLRHFEFEVERELREINPWRDVFVNFRYLRRFQIQGGKFKIPFSYDQLTGPTNLDFVYRSRIADQLAPARDLGFKAHGRLFARRLRYEAGVFKEDGENARLSGNVGSGERTFAGRLTGSPLSLGTFWKPLKTAELGLAMTSTTVPEGPKSLRGRLTTREEFFERFFVHGERRRFGAEFVWMPGPFSLKSELIRVREQRLGQGIRNDDIPDLVGRGFYVSGTWCLTGEPKADGIEPRKAFLTGGGVGAVEIAARFETIRFGSAEHPGRASRSTRAANILGNSDRAWTFGVNWYVNRWGKIQINSIREKLEDFNQSRRTPVPGRQIYFLHVVRLQFVL